MKKYHKKKSIEVKIFDFIVELFATPFRKKKFSNNKVIVDKDEILEKWQKVEELVRLGGESRFKHAVIEADKLFDAAMALDGIKGETTGERLKNAKDKFDWQTYQELWSAHKVRNDIVHAQDKELLSAEAEDTIKKFKKGLIGLGLI